MTKTIKTLTLILMEILVLVPFGILFAFNIIFPEGPETHTLFRVMTVLYTALIVILIPVFSLFVINMEDRQPTGCIYFIGPVFAVISLWLLTSGRKFFGIYSYPAHTGLDAVWFYLLLFTSWSYPLIIGIILIADRNCWKTVPEDISLAAAENSSSERFLLELAENDECGDVRKTAFGRLSGEEKFEHVLIFGNYPDIRLLAAEKINDQKILLQTAEKDEDEEVRTAAVRRINDADVLERIAKNDSSPKVRETALEKINDEALFEYAVKNDPSERIRALAMNRITDQDILEWVVEYDKSDSLRKAAYKKAGNPELLAQILSRHPDYVIWPEAVEIITEQSLLEQIALNDKDWGVRQAAVRRIENKDLIASIAIEDSVSAVRITAKSRTSPKALIRAVQKTDVPEFWMPADIIYQIEDEQTLKKIAVRDKQPESRAIAVSQISDTALLNDIALSDESRTVRLEAVRKVSDRMVLRMVIQDDDSMEVLRAAVNRTPDIDMKVLGWERILNHDSHDSAAADALRNLYLENHIGKRIKTVHDHTDYEDNSGEYCCYADYSDHSDTTYYIGKNEDHS